MGEWTKIWNIKELADELYMSVDSSKGTLAQSWSDEDMFMIQRV